MVIRTRISLLFLVFFTVACGGTEKKLLPYENFSFPVDLVYDNNNRNIYVVSSNFDFGYKFGNVKSISINKLKPLLSTPCKNECSEYNRGAINGSGVSIGDYAGISVFYNNKIFVPMRKDNIIAVIETDSTGNPDCGNGKKVLGDCDETHLIDTDYKEPFSLVSETSDNCIYASFLKSGNVVCVDRDNFKKQQNVFSDFSNGYEIGGVKDIDVSEDGILVSAYAYMMSGRNMVPLSYGFKGNRYTVFLDFTDQIGSAFQESVKISKQKKRFFMSLREPDLILSVDYGIYKDGTFIITDYRLISLHRYPSRLYVETPKSNGRELLFASLIDEDKIYVYDTESMILLTEIKEGLDGPYAMKIIDIDGEDYLFVANFENSTVSVYRLISGENRFEYILSIGKPRPKEKGEY